MGGFIPTAFDARQIRRGKLPPERLPDGVPYAQSLTSDAQSQLDAKASVVYVDAADAALTSAIASKAATSYVDTAVASAVSGLASESDVATAVAGLASESYVDAAVAGIDLSGKADVSYVDAADTSLQEAIDDLASTTTTALAGKASTTYVDAGDASLQGQVNAIISSLVGLASESYVDAAVSGLASESYVDAAVADLATEAYVTGAVSGLASTSYVDAGLAGKAAASHTHSGADITTGTIDVARVQYLANVTSDVQSQINGKAATSHQHSGADITSGTVPVARLPTAIPAASIGAGGVSNSEFGYLDGVTGPIQGQIDGKAATSHTQAFSTITGQATTAQMPDALIKSVIAPVRLTTSGNNLALVKVGGSRLYNPLTDATVDLTTEPTPLAATGQTPGALVNVWLDTSNKTLSADNTAIATSGGVEYKTGDTSKLLVGWAVADTGPVWVDSVTKGRVVSRFNRTRKTLKASGASQVNIPADNTWRTPGGDMKVDYIKAPNEAVTLEGVVELSHASATTLTQAGVDVGLTGTPATIVPGIRSSGSSSYFTTHPIRELSAGGASAVFEEARVRVYGDNSGSTDTFDIQYGAAANQLTAVFQG